MSNMTLEKLQTDHNDLFTQIQDKASKAGFEKGHNEGLKKGAEQERTRITGIQQASFTGQEDLCAKLIADGVTTAGEAAIQFNQSQKQVISEINKKAEAEAIKPVDNIENQTSGKKEEADFMSTVKQHQKDNNISLKDAMSAVTKQHPELHQKYLGLT
jgi:hypothetical protein